MVDTFIVDVSRRYKCAKLLVGNSSIVSYLDYSVLWLNLTETQYAAIRSVQLNAQSDIVAFFRSYTDLFHISEIGQPNKTSDWMNAWEEIVVESNCILTKYGKELSLVKRQGNAHAVEAGVCSGIFACYVSGGCGYHSGTWRRGIRQMLNAVVQGVSSGIVNCFISGGCGYNSGSWKPRSTFWASDNDKCCISWCQDESWAMWEWNKCKRDCLDSKVKASCEAFDSKVKARCEAFDPRPLPYTGMCITNRPSGMCISPIYEEERSDGNFSI
ncbi:hypothetical protein V1527DRAFT_477372, partial [Lipomyces starkeyi]